MKVVVLCIAIIAFFAVCMCGVLVLVYPLKYKQIISEESAIYGLDKVLVASIIDAESSFRPNTTSPKGARGLMQLMPATAEFVCGKIGEAYDEDKLFEPRYNIKIGTYYFWYLLDKFGDTKTALFAYNAGEGNVKQWLEDSQYTDTNNAGKKVLVRCPFNETNAYVKKVLGSYKFYKHRF